MTQEALKLALEALEQLDGIDTETECVTIDVGDVIDAIKEALAQPEQEPVAWISHAITSAEKAIDVAIKLEREACAKEAERTFYSVQAAENIRARGKE